MRTGIDQIFLAHNHTPVGMKPLSERDENLAEFHQVPTKNSWVGMKPLSERDENQYPKNFKINISFCCRNEATL